MAFAMNSAHTLEVTVEGRLRGQLIDTKMYYSYQGTLPSPDADVSTVWLTNFRTAWNVMITAGAYDTYTANNYTIREILTVTRSGAGTRDNPFKYRNTYRPDGIDFLIPSPPDPGGLPAAGLDQLPSVLTLRTKLTPLTRRIKHYKSNYMRLSWGWVETNADTVAETWNSAFITSINAVFATFKATAITGVAVPAGNQWKLSCWSPGYWYENLLAGGQTNAGSIQVDTMKAQAYIGTQITRRYDPLGRARGR